MTLIFNCSVQSQLLSQLSTRGYSSRPIRHHIKKAQVLKSGQMEQRSYFNSNVSLRQAWMEMLNKDTGERRRPPVVVALAHEERFPRQPLVASQGKGKLSPIGNRPALEKRINRIARPLFCD